MHNEYLNSGGGVKMIEWAWMWCGNRRLGDGRDTTRRAYIRNAHARCKGNANNERIIETMG